LVTAVIINLIRRRAGGIGKGGIRGRGGIGEGEVGEGGFEGIFLFFARPKKH
jgi:hypothetical protein